MISVIKGLPLDVCRNIFYDSIYKNGPTFDRSHLDSAVSAFQRYRSAHAGNQFGIGFAYSTPEEKNARAYSKVELITVGGANYEVGSYLAAPDNTCKGVVKGVDLDFSEEEITGMIVHPRNPTALEVKRIRNTTTVVVLFDGLKVPNYVVCGPSMLRCTLYRRQTDVCYACGRLGHRADVCPTPENTICRGCGIESPTEDHVCTPECALCGGPHPTADKSCKQRFHMPYIVRRRRRERQKVKSPASPIRERAQSRSSSRGRSETPRSRSKNRSSSRGRSRSKGPPTVRIHEPPAPGPTEWADRVKGTASRVRRDSSPPPEHSAARLLQLERENASLRNALEQLRAEMDEMKRAGQGQSVQRPLPPVTERAETPIETLMEIPAETPAPRRPAKKRALSQPILDEGIDELRAELRGFQSELRDALNALSEAVSAMNARVDSVESKITITDQLSGSVVRTASPSSMAAESIRRMTSRGVEARFALTVTMKGRWTVLKAGQPTDFLSECVYDPSAESFGSVTEVCEDPSFSYEIHNKSGVYGELYYNQADGRVFSYDSLFSFIPKGRVTSLPSRF
ncbi:hypothetical protein HPB52_002041 [Rhipicephalus sanguineus]|uniref:CCHC-type domain-containing protein n=1 Tax=Rhipicephalus sanguineus TaxID=34632 RepID=A0A9D4SQI6_RHISA|nr:hypothetical protein HPB52_002041 [Rhipicephalus sanguineus]